VSPASPAKAALDRSKGENTLQPSDPTPDNGRAENREDRHLSRTFVWIGVGIGVAGLGAALAFSIVRAVVSARRPPDDPTSQRIQQLIDEANSLLKTLDDQRNSA
jgi:hypothetical protein